MRIAKGSTRIALIGRILENQNEARLSKILGETVVPTWLSLFGIVNVQATAKPHNLTGTEIYDALFEEIGRQACTHTLAHAHNYGVHKGKLKIVK